jgi:hypothetical protein
MRASVLVPPSAQVVKLADTLASGASDRKVVKVQVLSWAPLSGFLTFGNVRLAEENPRNTSI